MGPVGMGEGSESHVFSVVRQCTISWLTGGDPTDLPMRGKEGAGVVGTGASQRVGNAPEDGQEDSPDPALPLCALGVGANLRASPLF